jgi:MerR family transcriptional regulator, light-induced transcriptional regulator
VNDRELASPEQLAAVADGLGSRRQAIIDEAMDAAYARWPEMLRRFGEPGRQRCAQDYDFHLRYLEEAVAAGSIALFEDYAAWGAAVLEGVNVPRADLVANLELLAEVLHRHLGADAARLCSRFIDAGLACVREGPEEAAEAAGEQGLPSLAGEYLSLLLGGDRRGAVKLLTDAVEQGMDIRECYLNTLQPAQHEVGRLWQARRISVAQEHFCTAVTQLVMSQLYARIATDKRVGRTMVAASIGGDLHEVGLRMVADFFEMDGWDAVYLGANVPVASIVDTVFQSRAEVLALSVTMTFNIGAARDLIQRLRSHPDGRAVRVLVGGYPFSVDPGLWRTIGADAAPGGAAEAAHWAREHFGLDRTAPSAGAATGFWGNPTNRLS